MKHAESSSGIFDKKDYKSCLSELLDTSGKRAKGQKSRLAEFLRCQPAYISRVLNGDAHLSLEQGEATARFFVLNRAESKYFIALLGEERAGTGELKEFWREQKIKALEDRFNLNGRVKLEMPLSDTDRMVYFSEWYYAAIHVALTVPKLQNPTALAAYLEISPALARRGLSFLCKIGVAKKEGDRYLPTQLRLHLDKRSSFVNNHHLNWRIKSLEATNRPKESDFRYSSVVSLSRSDLEKVRSIMLAAVERVRTTVQESKEETLACYQFDFFELQRGDV